MFILNPNNTIITDINHNPEIIIVGYHKNACVFPKNGSANIVE